jgi:hypothetical protein
MKRDKKGEKNYKVIANGDININVNIPLNNTNNTIINKRKNTISNP